MKQKPGLWIALWVILVVVTGFLAFGDGYGGRGYGPWHGWGHMQGWGDRYSADGAPGWHGFGPGMMGDADTGYGWGMGNPHGMMGLYGGSGGAYGPGYGGMMPGLPQNMTEEQTKKFSQLQGEVEKENSSLIQQVLDAQSKLSLLYASDKPDWNAIRLAAKKLAELQRKQMDAAIEMQQKIDGLLTDSQRQEMARAMRSYGWNR